MMSALFHQGAFVQTLHATGSISLPSDVIADNTERGIHSVGVALHACSMDCKLLRQLETNRIVKNKTPQVCNRVAIMPASRSRRRVSISYMLPATFAGSRTQGQRNKSLASEKPQQKELNPTLWGNCPCSLPSPRSPTGSTE